MRSNSRKKIRPIVLILTVVASALRAWAQPAAPQPRPFFAPDGTVEKFDITPDGALSVYWQQRKNNREIFHRTTIELPDEKATDRVVDALQWRWKNGQTAVSKDGNQVVLPPSSENAGDRIFAGHAESDEDYSLSWLRLISPSGSVSVLKKLPMFLRLCDLRFSPDGREVLALTTNVLWRSTVTTGHARRVVRKGGGALGDDDEWWKNLRQVWVHSPENPTGTGAMLSPDGRFIVGFATNSDANAHHDDDLDGRAWRAFIFSDLLIFDARTGEIVRRIALPKLPTNRHWDRRPFRARFTTDGSHILVEGPNWDKVLCVRWQDGKRVNIFDWEAKPYGSGLYRPEPILSSDGLYFCDRDGDDITVRSVLTGHVVRRAKAALAAVAIPYDPHDLKSLPGEIVIQPNLSALYFQPVNDHMLDNRVWRWPLSAATTSNPKQPN